MSKNISGNYGTHLAPLIRCVELTTGDVLELGTGYFSTPYLHYKCQLDNRKLVSIDNDRGWIRRFADSDFYNHFYRSPMHEFIYVEDWSKAPIEKPWDVVLVDHTPDERRKEEAIRVKDLAKYVIIHDSNENGGAQFRGYHYDQLFPHFKYKKVWDKDRRHATVLSNFIDLSNLW
jgi:hypothetical protein